VKHLKGLVQVESTQQEHLLANKNGHI